MTEDSIILLFKAFFGYKSTYISYFHQKIIRAANGSVDYSRKNANDRLDRYINTLQSNFFYVEAYDRCPDFCNRWLNDIKSECEKVIDEVLLKYGKKKKQAKI